MYKRHYKQSKCTGKNSNFEVPSKLHVLSPLDTVANLRKWLLTSLFPSVIPHGTVRLTREEFL